MCVLHLVIYIVDLMIRGCVMNGVNLTTLVNVLVACANVVSFSFGRAVHGHGLV